MNTSSPVCSNKESVAALISKGKVEDIPQKETKELMKVSLDWSLPNGEVSNDIILKPVFFTKGGQGVCEASQPDNGKQILKGSPFGK